MSKVVKRKAYALAGVDIDLGNRVKKGLQEKVSVTFGPEVLGRIGGFGGLFKADFRGMKEPVLVSSMDGVGTKLKIAIATRPACDSRPGSCQPLHRRYRCDRCAPSVFSRLYRR